MAESRPMEQRPEAPSPHRPPDPPRSWWILATLPAGLTTWAGFLYAGIRARKPLTIAAAVVYFVAFAVAFMAAGSASDEDNGNWAGGLIILVWATGIAHALIIRKGIAEAIAEHDAPHVDAARDRIRRREQARRLAQEEPKVALEMGLGSGGVPDWYAAGLVDVNHANAEVLAGLPCVDRELAERIVATRTELGAGFTSVDDLGMTLDLPADTVEQLRERTVYLMPDDE